MAALRAAVFPLSVKNRRGGHFLPPPPARVKRVACLFHPITGKPAEPDNVDTLPVPEATLEL